jgi:uncharacterized protein (TIGR02145 family)
MCLLLFVALACKKEAKPKPQVTTGTISAISDAGATCAGTLVSDGSSPIVTTGVCWSRSNKLPTIKDHKTSDGVLSGDFSGALTDLNPYDTYYVRAYATNQNGQTAYGEVKTFKTLPGIVYDNDSPKNTYHTITIGTQVWMQENWKCPYFTDGNPIPYKSSNSDWLPAATGPAVCVYDNNTSYKADYGLLYNWYAATDSKFAPAGWHVPSSEEWDKLIMYLGGYDVAGGKLKEHSTAHWNAPNLIDDYDSGFNVRGSGFRDGSSGLFDGLKNVSSFLYSDNSDNNACKSNKILNGELNIPFRTYWSNSGYSIRLMRNTPAKE